MLPTPDPMEIARQAHAAWCDGMRRRGWTAGETYDERARTHDALVPFDQLVRRDRLAALRAAEYEGTGALAAIIDYRRGPDRDFTIDEMRPGLRVVCTAEGPVGEPPLRGVVSGWQTDESGELVSMTVRWDDGSTSEHVAFAGELAREESERS